MAETRQNPNNPTNSSCVQILLDMNAKIHDQAEAEKAQECIEYLLKFTKEREEYRKSVDRLWDTHAYPENSLTWGKNYFEYAIEKVLTGDATKVLLVFMRYINQSNTLQVSFDRLAELAGVSEKTARRGVAQLLKYGCIAKETPGIGRTPTTYMLNPLISRVGNSNKWTTPEDFWKLTKSVYEFNKKGNIELKERSEAHRNWDENIAHARKHDRATITFGSKKDKDFKKIGTAVEKTRKQNKKTAPSLGDDEAAAEIK